MTKLNLDEIWKPKRLIVQIDGSEFAVRRLTVADARRIATFAEHDDADNASWLATLFEGKPPRFVADLGADLDEQGRQDVYFRVLSLVDLLGMFYMENETLGKKLAAAHLRLVELVTPPESSTESSPVSAGSST